MRRASLRLRLFALILTPLTIMAIILGYWRLTEAQQTAEELFDRSLLAAALAISRDVAISDGDAILPSTRKLIEDASGGEVFYHATGPGGIYVTGYAYPPVNPQQTSNTSYEPEFFEASYRGELARILRVTERVTIENLSGDTTVTVWQRLADRQAFARLLAERALALMGGLLATLALVVWFGVQLGLRPLTDLQEAIALRSADDLSRIRRAVPVEVKGIARTLNRLFSQVEKSIDAQQMFISDAAHQLRNPAAAVQSMAEAVKEAPTPAERDKRLAELVEAARSSARIADQLLSLDRLQQPTQATNFHPVDLQKLVRDTCTDMAPHLLSKGVAFELDTTDAPLTILADGLFVAEAIKNLIDNALKHGGPKMSALTVTLRCHEERAQITVADNGKGLSPDQSDVAFSRFSQIEPSEGSGLGLAIVSSVAERHNGRLVINHVPSGASLTLSLPALPADAASAVSA